MFLVRVDGSCLAFIFQVYLCFLDVYKFFTVKKKYNFVQTYLIQSSKKHMRSLLAQFPPRVKSFWLPGDCHGLLELD
jgi:hypothetical protein